MLALAGRADLGRCAEPIADPADAVQRIRTEFERGELRSALADSDAALAAPGLRSSADAAVRQSTLRVLKAEILLNLQHPADVLTALGCDGTNDPWVGNPAIKRRLLCGLAHSYLGQPGASARELIAAHRLADSARSPLIAEVLWGEGIVQIDAGRLRAAAEKLEKSLARAAGNPLLQAADRVAIAYVSLQRGNFDQAVALCQDAAAYAKSIRARVQVQWALGNLGWAYQNLGDFEHALSNFREAGQLAQDIGMARARMFWLEDAGLAAYRLGMTKDARNYDEEALRTALQLAPTDQGDQIVNIEANLALLLHEQGDDAAAKRFGAQALAAARRSTDANKIAYATFLTAKFGSRPTAASEAVASPTEIRKLLSQARLMTTDPDLRAEIDHEMANSYRRSGQPKRAEAWFLQSIRTFERKRSTVRNEALRLSSFAYGSTIFLDYATFLIDAGRSEDALQLLDGSRARTLEEGLGFAAGVSGARTGDRVDARALALKLGASILFYALGPDKSYLWAITDRESRIFTLPGAKEIEDLIEQYQRVIQRAGDPLQADTRSAAALYDLLLGPAAAMIAARPVVYLIPDGALHALNFEALVERGAGTPHYWIENVTLTVTGSIAMLSRAKLLQPAPAARGLLMIGNPIAAAGQFPALPHAADEVERIRAHFPPDAQRVLTQAQASPPAYAASSPGRYAYIHFVAHGTPNRLSPLESAVVLSPPPDHPTQFMLYARDIVQHPLHAQLVTVSACFGSGIRAYAGEGLVGLAWAFLRAGSHHVISALWEVDDDSTPRLMDRLYAEIAAGKSPDSALRTAKLSMIHSSGIHRKPYYWAAFQLYAGS